METRGMKVEGEEEAITQAFVSSFTLEVWKWKEWLKSILFALLRDNYYHIFLNADSNHVAQVGFDLKMKAGMHLNKR